MSTKPTIILDFDGVIHSYDSGWEGAHIISDPPTKGAKEAIAKLRKKYKVVVVSSRCSKPGGIAAIKDWLAKHDIQVDDVMSEKPGHVCVVDDRALRFNGNWDDVVKGVDGASVPWNKKGKEIQP